MTTPNMGLVPPTVSSTPGPEWASLLNAALEAIDAHTHQNGSGVKITPAAININATLELNSYDLSEVNSVLLDDRSSNISARGVFAKSGELYYRDTAGNNVQITASGSVNAGTGSISGMSGAVSAAFATDTFTWSYAASKFARMANGDISLYPYNGSVAYTKAVTLKAPVGLEAASSYTLTFPTIIPPSSVEYVSIDTSGNLDHATLSGTSNQVTVSASATAITLSLPATVATTQFSAAAGSVAAPSLVNTADTDTGVYFPATGRVGFSINGALGFLVDDASQVRGADGLVTAPTYSFINDANTGFYSAAADRIGVTTAGVQRLLIDDGGQIRATAGSAAAPAWSFILDSDTGAYDIGSDQYGIATGGVLRLTVNTANVISTLPVNVPLGTVSLPGLVFAGDTNTGIYSTGADTLDFSTGGTRRVSIDTNGRVQFSDGTAGAPAISFISDTDTGVYNGGANQLSIASAGVHVSTFVNGQQRSADGSAASPVYSFLTSGSTGFYRTAGNAIGFSFAGASVGTWSSTSLNIDTPVSIAGAVTMTGSGGTAIAHKTTIVTGTITTGSTGTSIFSGATVYAVEGWVENDGVGGYVALSNTIPTGLSTSVRISTSSTATNVKLANDTGGTRTYYAKITHA